MSSDFERRDRQDRRPSAPGRGGEGRRKDGRAGNPSGEGRRSDGRGGRPDARGNHFGANRGNSSGSRTGANRAQHSDRRGGKPAQKGDSPRNVALAALQDVVRSEAYASQALDRRLGEAKLSPEDRRLAASLFYFAAENRLYIEAALKPFLQDRPEPVVVDILHIAAAQLLFMDRIPDHAAVDEAVKQVRARRGEGMTGLVNAVLHNLIRARDAGEIRLPDRESDPVGWLSARWSLAPAVAQALIDAYGLEEAEAFAAWQPDRRAQSIRPNPGRTDAAGFEKWLDGQGLTWRHGMAKGAYVVENGGNLASGDGYRKGLFSIQGQSAMLAAQAVQARPGMQILDACAAPGGKTCQMAEAMQGSGRVYAWDVHPHRVELIRAAARRLGLDNVRPSEHDARKPLDSLRLGMDAVLVDAPCSGLGVIADKPDIKYRQSAESLAALPEVQREILDACAEAVKVGGLLIYATCTVLPAENQDQVAAFLDRHPEFERDVDSAWLPEALRGRLEDGEIQILPQRDGLEGFFIARLRRKGV